MSNFEIIVNGKKFPINTGRENATRIEILVACGFSVGDHVKLIQVFRFGRKETVDPNDKVDLAVPDLEKFIVEFSFQIEVNGQIKTIITNKEWVSRKEVLKEFGIEDLETIELLQVFRFERQEVVDESDKVDLAPEVIEKFITKAVKITYYLDNEAESTSKRKMSPNEILKENGLEPKQFYLKQIISNKTESYKSDEKAKQQIRIKNGMRFISCKKGPASVSYQSNKKGIELFKEQLTILNYNPVQNGQFVIFDYVIPHGKYMNQKVKLGLQIPTDFPLKPPTGPYIKEPLRTVEGGIHKRKVGQENWQYWSRPCNTWAQSPKNVRTYIAHINTIFDND